MAEIAALIQSRNKVLDRIAAEHADTPLAVLARRERDLPLGLAWKPWAK